MSKIPDQRPVWERKHAAGEHDNLRHIPSPLSELAEPYFPRQSRILELGCGVGRDAMFFVQKGHNVIATDSSETVIKQNRQHFTDENADFKILDMQEPLPYESESFDVVYANLSLHYYSDQTTKEIIEEIARVLKAEGILAFACKSYDDLHSSGKEIGKNIFQWKLGVTIHLFSEEYAKSLVKDNFDIQHLDEVEEDYNGRYSRIVRCIAKKSGKNWGEL
ncbi:class I SAM-dependent methyltransferase [Candidatus Saccharibacteria bacterium]|nr:class I SAM-dependent methyltransferase [Candidatus Saccharibacteria bacterium]